MNGNFKVKCLSNSENNQKCYTIGKIYEVKDGKLTTDNGVKIPQYTDINTFEEWKDFSNSSWELVAEQSTEYISIIRKKNRVVATITKGEDKYTQSIALSKANNDYKTAVKMVVDRLMERWNGFEVEEVVAVDKPLTAYKEVHRPAKVGEWVKIVDADCGGCGNNYKNGDIMQIVKIDCDDRHFGQGSGQYLYSSEYVVLENYQPEEHKPMPSKDDVNTCNKVSRRAEVGEWVEIIKVSENGYKDYKVGDIMQIVSCKRSMEYPYYKDKAGSYLYDEEYIVLENFNSSNLPSTEKPDISILDNFTFEDIAKYLFHKVGDGK